MPITQAPSGRAGLFLAALFVLTGCLGASAPGARSGDDLFEFALIDADNNSTMSVGNLEHWKGFSDLEEQSRASGRPLFWFSKGDREYVVRDPALIERARTIAEPMAALGRKQGKLGAKQGKIGARQGQIGALQGRAGALQARIALSGLSDDPEAREDTAALRTELHELQRQIDELANEQSSLGVEQARLGAEQAELGKQQAGATRGAIAGLRELAEDAIASGKAERLRD